MTKVHGQNYTTVQYGVSLLFTMKNGNRGLFRESPEDACILNALMVLYFMQNLRMHSVSQGDVNCPALTWIKSKVQHHSPVNHDESSRFLLLYFPCKDNTMLYRYKTSMKHFLYHHH